MALAEDVSSSLPTEFTGQMLVRLSEGHCVQLCGSEGRGRQTKRINMVTLMLQPCDHPQITIIFTVNRALYTKA